MKEKFLGMVRLKEVPQKYQDYKNSSTKVGTEEFFSSLRIEEVPQPFEN
jgi:hypothetical protein